ncbi:hypothetical protein BJV74DRAFT_152784 [Russula compacta]|nr:hypothetical protein BJV74DRAFT_152784 [Russula compacta]
MEGMDCIKPYPSGTRITTRPKHGAMNQKGIGKGFGKVKQGRRGRMACSGPNAPSVLECINHARLRTAQTLKRTTYGISWAYDGGVPSSGKVPRIEGSRTSAGLETSLFPLLMLSVSLPRVGENDPGPRIGGSVGDGSRAGVNEMPKLDPLRWRGKYSGCERCMDAAAAQGFTIT